MHARRPSSHPSTHPSTKKPICTHPSTHPYRYTCTDTYIRAWMCTWRIHPRIHRRIRAHIHPHIHPRIHRRIRAHIHAHIPCTPAMRAARIRALDGAWGQTVCGLPGEPTRVSAHSTARPGAQSRTIQNGFHHMQPRGRVGANCVWPSGRANVCTN